MAFNHPAKFSALKGLEFRSKKIVEGFLSGLHKSPFQGFSVEFSEYRNYNSGDSTRYIDWKVFAKTDKLTVKKFEAETNLRAFIVLDCSRSMDYSSIQLSKFDYARNLSAAFLYLLSKQNDAISFTAFSDSIHFHSEAKSGSFHVNNLLKKMENLSTKGSNALDNILIQLRSKIFKRSYIVVLTDCFFPRFNETMKEIALWKRQGHHVILFHLIDKNEKELNFPDYIALIDSESGEEIDIRTDIVKNDYQNLFDAHVHKIANYCKKEAIYYFKCYNDSPYEHHLYELLSIRSKQF